MPEQFHQTVYLASFVISVCFSFSILLLAVLIKNAEHRNRLYAFAFLPVFLLNLTAVFLNDTETSVILSSFADVLLLLGIMAAILSRKGAISAIPSVTVPPAAIAAICLSAPFREFLYRRQISQALIITFSVAVLYLLRRKKGSESLVFWSVVLLAACVPAGLFLRRGITAFAAPLLKLGSYILMLRYLYMVLLKSLISKYETISRKLSSLDKSIEIEVLIPCRRQGRQVSYRSGGQRPVHVKSKRQERGVIQGRLLTCGTAQFPSPAPY